MDVGSGEGLVEEERIAGLRSRSVAAGSSSTLAGRAVGKGTGSARPAASLPADAAKEAHHPSPDRAAFRSE